MPRFAFLSTYPPTKCGIATFAESLATALRDTGPESIRVVRSIDGLDSPTAELGARIAVVGELHMTEGRRTNAAARLLSAAEVVIVQHEYGIYGGTDGSDVVEVLEALTSPSIVVLHTVLGEPTPGQRRVLERVCAAATAIVVMTDAALATLSAHYRVDLSRVTVIPHGVPVWDDVLVAPSIATHPDRTTVLTWGLIGPGKGLEWGIRAVAAVRDLSPAVHYEILGETHPKVLAHEGEAYRERLSRLAVELGIADRVSFDSRYLDTAGLAARVAAADVVLLPYDSRTQVTSGVLVEALAAGKPVVATGFPHALELLHPEAIALHESPASIARALRGVLARPVELLPPAVIDASWSTIADRYRALAATLCRTAVAQTA